MNETTRWNLPLLASGQAQKEVTHNEALLAVDGLLHLAVASRGLASPPMLADAGEIHIIAPGAEEDWVGLAGQLASYDGFGWTIVVPRIGCLAWLIDEQALCVFTRQGWTIGGGVADMRQGDRRASGGALTVDTECRSALADLITRLRDKGVDV